ncbi:MAG TPA: ORF6N domain-containing protein [Ignavibacteria bacterium]|nr:ORF6N domain-containing protein [Ignavibacteria bacterium]
MSDNNKGITVSNIQNRIFTFREFQVMIDRDLAELYDVPTKRLNEQVKRNLNRFPDSFRFQLTDNEKDELVANCDRFEKLKHSTVNPYAFTEQGVAMLSAVLHSQTAVDVSIRIMEAFVEMRKFILNNVTVFQRLDKIEQKQIESDKRFELLFQALENNSIKPKQGIFYNGQVFDAYLFVSDLIKSAKKSIVLMDNYVDETVLTMFSKNQKINVKIYTKNISKQLKLDLDKYNSQYKPIELKNFNKAHDRFLIIDNKEIYHFGASLKDLGKKWFAFSKFDMEAIEILGKIES